MTVTNEALTGKLASVTGAGIGRAAAVAFARGGARVALVDRSPDGLGETARLIEEAGGQALALACDVTSEDDVQSALDGTVQAFERLDVAFNNAGIEQPVKPAADIAKDEWDRVIGVSLTGMFLCMKYQIPTDAPAGGRCDRQRLVRRQCQGLQGTAGLRRGQARRHRPDRSAAFGYAALNVRVKAVCLGIIETEMIRRFAESTPGGRDALIADEPIGRLGTPEETAAAVLRLCSDAAFFTTGHARSSTVAQPSDSGS
ncbi:SDR family oxidoreductase [Streptomyces sp. A30]|uniref:SDR family oxidoreductase n=1 Tax=Streptomyces sp. A30 TaxID=2789273 RepID=UPI0039810701